MGVLPEEDLVLSLFSHLKTHPFIPSQEGNLSMTCSKRRRIFHISSKRENLSLVCLTGWRFALIVIVVLAIQDGELICCLSHRVEVCSYRCPCHPRWRTYLLPVQEGRTSQLPSLEGPGVGFH